ncbi:DUF6966 domain-containing protein [Rufibacter aurantiacus]|uniref:DUF6966 domain-containing protein n=1 Tax=Rufibacter aurantiacus TaxID=2817374 RepID=UPI001B314BE7|nr:hypothetical protein [Rufibacter aurantiacus]
MTDYYKISLDILFRLLKESDNQQWKNWIAKDIYLWETQKRVDHHLSAFGGMGSINDLSVGGSDTIDVWKNKLFDSIKTLSWSLAKGRIPAPPIDEKFYRLHSNELSGWRCTLCGHSRINKSAIELYLSNEFIPKLIVDYIKLEKLLDILDMKSITTYEQVVDKRQKIEKLIESENITLTDGNEWLCTCPKCKDKNVCVFRWHINDEYTQLVESKGNLKIRPKVIPAHNSSVQRWWQKLFKFG